MNIQETISQLVKNGKRAEARQLALSVANPHAQHIVTRKHEVR